MAIMSKPYKLTVQLLGSYLTALYMNPIRTKSLTAATVAVVGNYTAQTLAGARSLNLQTLSAFGLFGLLFGGTVPHYFHSALQRLINEEARYAPYVMFLIERLLYMPLYSFFSLYTLARFEFKSHNEAIGNLLRYYPAIYEANIKYLSVAQFINMYFVPPVLRVLFMNLIGFFWVIYVARKRTPPARKSKGRSS